MKTALVLSGGGSKGDFELGAIELLYARGVRPDILCGTSVGALNAVKLAEGEEAGATKGLGGLVRLWEGLRNPSHMFVQEAWLGELPDWMRNVVLGHGIHPPSKPDYMLGWLADAIWMLRKGGDLLEDIARGFETILETGTSIYSLRPIHEKLLVNVDQAAVRTWASNGRKLRICIVGLESGRLRYVTENGAILERDGKTPVTDVGAVPAQCAAEGAAVSRIEAKVLELSDRLRNAVASEKIAILEQLQVLKADKSVAEAALRACAARYRGVPVQTSLVEAALASAAIPVIFGPVRIANETYVDGGVRMYMPLRPAFDLGAEVVYAIATSPLEPPPDVDDYSKLINVALRATTEILPDEVFVRDVMTRPDGLSPEVHLIVPDFEVHENTDVDPGLISISRHYGYMRAADTLDGVQGSTRWDSATAITRTRLGIWHDENVGFGSPPVGGKAKFADNAALERAKTAKKSVLARQLADRKRAGGPLPSGIERFVQEWELHHYSPPGQIVETTVPDVTQTYVNGAAAKIRAAKLVPVFSGPLGKGAWVLGQTPKGGTKAPAMSEVKCRTTDKPLY